MAEATMDQAEAYGRESVILLAIFGAVLAIALISLGIGLDAVAG